MAQKQDREKAEQEDCVDRKVYYTTQKGLKKTEYGLTLTSMKTKCKEETKYGI